MTNIMLKTKLLSTGYFINNKYFKHYLKLIESNSTTKYQCHITQKHHILQKSFFKLTGVLVDESKQNLVNLLYRDHCLAHWLLYNCTKKELKKANGYAYRKMINCGASRLKNISDLELKVLQDNYQKTLTSINKNELNSYLNTHTLMDTAKYFAVSIKALHNFMTTNTIYTKKWEQHLKIQKISYQQFIAAISAGTTSAAIKQLNISYSSFYRLCKKFNIQYITYYDYNKINKEAFIYDYNTLTKADLLLKYKITSAQYSYYAKKYSIKKIHLKLDKDKIKDLYINKNYSKKALCKMFGCSLSWLTAFIKQNNLLKHKKQIDLTVLNNIVYKYGKGEAAKYFNCSIATINRCLKQIKN